MEYTNWIGQTIKPNDDIIFTTPGKSDKVNILIGKFIGIENNELQVNHKGSTISVDSNSIYKIIV